MLINSAEFIPLGPETSPDPGLVMRVIIHVSGVEQRAVPIMARVGGQAVQGLMALITEEGLQGFLRETPAICDELLLGFADGPIIHTEITFTPAVS